MRCTMWLSVHSYRGTKHTTVYPPVLCAHCPPASPALTHHTPPPPQGTSQHNPGSAPEAETGNPFSLPGAFLPRACALCGIAAQTEIIWAMHGVAPRADSSRLHQEKRFADFLSIFFFFLSLRPRSCWEKSAWQHPPLSSPFP